MVATIQKPNHLKNKQNFVQIPNGLRQNGCHFFKDGTPLENQTEGYHWNSKRIRYFSPHCIEIIIICYHRKSLVRRVWWFSVIRTSFDGFGKWLIHGVDRQHTYVEAVGWVRPDSAASQEVLVEVDEQLVQLGRVLDTKQNKMLRKIHKWRHANLDILWIPLIL